MMRTRKMIKTLAVNIFFAFAFTPIRAIAHHGGVVLGNGPGSPIETNSSLSLPEGGFSTFFRNEHVEFRKFDWAKPENTDSFTFFNLGFSYGIKPYLSASLFLPYSIKRQDTLGSSEGFGDIKFLLNLGFNYDPEGRFGLNTNEDTAISLEEMRKTYLSVFGGFTLPTGNSYERHGGVIDRGMQPGFRSPTFSVGTAATRQLAESLTLVGDTTYDMFTEKNDFKFGNEWRLNLATVYELYGNPQRTISKIDGIVELNLLNIARDEEQGNGLRASGGTIFYLSPGIRFSVWKANLGFLLKFPVLKDLNEENEQQGSEGNEGVRAIMTISFFF